MEIDYRIEQLIVEDELNQRTLKRVNEALLRIDERTPTEQSELMADLLYALGHNMKIVAEVMTDAAEIMRLFEKEYKAMQGSRE